MNYIDILKKGSGIHIKKANRGKFTDYCGGKVTSECISKGKHSSDPAVRKRATFAANARKWKHQSGGVAKYGKGFYSSEDVQEPEEQNTFRADILSRTNNIITSKEKEEEKEDTGWDDLFSESETEPVSSSTTITLPAVSSSKSKARGDRNNNWLNLRISKANWRGKKLANTDGAFEQFETAVDGFRAGLKNMQNHIKRGKNTVATLISTWAPAVDNNNTTSYISNVLKRTGLKATDILNPDDKEQMINLAYAMAISENGYAPNKQDIEKGWDLLSKA